MVVESSVVGIPDEHMNYFPNAQAGMHFETTNKQSKRLMYLQDSSRRWNAFETFS